MDELLKTLGHVAEIKRTLRIFIGPQKENLSELEVVELANQSAGETSRYPNPRVALRFSRLIGLVRYSKSKYHLTPRGKSYLQENIKGLDSYQNKFLLGILLDYDDMRHNVRDVFVHAYSSDHLRIPQEVITTAELQRTMRLLQQLDCFKYKDGFFVLNPEFENLVDEAPCHLN